MATFPFIERLARQAGSAGFVGWLATWIVLGGPAASRRAHREAWAPELKDGGDGLTVFQRREDAAVQALLKERRIALERRVADGDDERDARSVVLSTPGPVTITLYPDEAMVRGAGEALDIHRWDTRTPHELRDCVIEMLRRQLKDPGVP